jgi:hypothetical protein
VVLAVFLLGALRNRVSAIARRAPTRDPKT